MLFLRLTALAVAMGICALGVPARAQTGELRHRPPTVPASYVAPNLVRAEPDPVPEAVAPPETRPFDLGARFRDTFLGGLLGYGAAAGLGALLGMIDADGDDERQPLIVALIAPLGLATGVWLGGLVNGGSRYDGAMLGTLIGTLLAVAMIGAVGGPSLEDPATISIGLLVPLIGAMAGAEIASAALGARF